MPLYEYRCRSCGSVSEFLVGFGEEDISCRICGSKEMERILSLSHVSKSAIIGKNKGLTCCGREERCEIPPCSEGLCRR